MRKRKIALFGTAGTTIGFVLLLPRLVDEVDGWGQSMPLRVQIADLDEALRLFHYDVGRYPTDTEGFSALRSRPDIAGWDGSPGERETLAARPVGETPRRSSRSIRWLFLPS